MARVAGVKGAKDALLDAAVKMAKKLAPGATKVTVGEKTRKLVDAKLSGTAAVSTNTAGGGETYLRTETGIPSHYFRTKSH
ncbi:MAG TPA: hypothetical protein VH575_11955 [Gemmataceae bacterium]|jgi:hypothetical protein